MARVDTPSRLLIVDDEPVVQQLLAEVLRGEADELAIAGGVEEARALVEPGFTVALIDKNLPDGSGLALVSELRAQVPDAAIVLMTAYASLDTAIEALRAGAYDYVHKPFASIHELVLKVRHAREKVELTRHRQRLTEQLHQVQRMEALGRMAGTVAHDFNNTLAVISMTSQWVAHELPADARPSVREGLVTIDEAVTSATSLVRSLLTFARRQPVASEVVDVNDVLAGMSRLMRGALRSAHTLVVTPARSACRVLADRGALEQVVMNLVINARDAIGDQGTITVVVRRDGGQVELSVADDGCGIAPEHLGRVFEPFFTTREAQGGTGLGLATVYGVVQGLGGTIDVASTPGLGTTFTLRLPAASASRSTAPPPLANRVG